MLILTKTSFSGGSSGIGLAAAKLLLAKNATVHVIDLTEPDDDESWQDWPRFHVHKADTRNWLELSDAFTTIDVMDYVFANAGLGALTDDLMVDHVDDDGRLVEPKYIQVDTNIRGVCHTSEFSNADLPLYGQCSTPHTDANPPDSQSS